MVMHACVSALNAMLRMFVFQLNNRVVLCAIVHVRKEEHEMVLCVR